MSFTTAELATYNKGALREACRAVSIGYTSLNNDAMRDVLAPFASDYSDAAAVVAADAAIETATNEALASIDGIEVANVETAFDTAIESALATAIERGESVVTLESVADALPAPAFDLPIAAVVPVPVFDASYIASIAVPRDPRALFAATKPAKVEKVHKVREVRDEANGVKRPSATTLCGRVWGWCDAQCAAGVRPEAKALRAALVDIDPTTCTVQYYRWRKFNGITGR